jgi:glycosyltransferase involved in cell wall biosynthesis
MIESKHKINVPNAKFSLLIPTWNNLEYLKLCIGSILKNSYFQHQIILHINEGSDGSLEWAKENNISYTYSNKNIGICWAMNAMRTIADTDYLIFINDDMYVCPNWDLELWKEIEKLPDNYFYLSSTLIQPRKFWCKSIISPVDFGQNVKEFDEETLLKHYMNLPHHDWKGSTWPPTIVHKEIWDLIGGYSVELTPGLYSDPDFSAKLYLAGVRYFKGIDSSRVYHFEARSTQRVKRNNGSKQFLFKWGITSSSFMTHILQRGEPYGYRKRSTKRLRFSLLRGKLKQIIWSITPSGIVNKLWEI